MTVDIDEYDDDDDDDNAPPSIEESDSKFRSLCLKSISLSGQVGDIHARIPSSTTDWYSYDSSFMVTYTSLQG